MTPSELERKAQRFEALVETKIVREHGMIPMFVRAADCQLPTAEDYKGAYRHRHLNPSSQKKMAKVLEELGLQNLKAKTEEEIGLPPMHVWRAWENTATDTAYYLAAMAYKYRCTGDPKDLAICRRTFGALKYIFSLTAAKGERGRICKPYGGVWSNQGGSDQSQCVTWGLSAYRGIAPPEDLADYNRMISEKADYNIKAKYVDAPHGYFAMTPEICWAHNFGDEKWSMATWSNAVNFVTEQLLAWQAGGDSRFLREVERWYAACAGKPAGGHQKDLYLGALMMELDPFHREVWRGLMQAYFTALPSRILPDGTSSSHIGRAAIDAMGCVTAQRWFPGMDMIAVARRILENLDEDTFRFVRPGEKPPWAGADDTFEQWAVESKMIDGDSLTAWLAAFWEGHWRGYW